MRLRDETVDLQQHNVHLSLRLKGGSQRVIFQLQINRDMVAQTKIGHKFFIQMTEVRGENLTTNL